MNCDQIHETTPLYLTGELQGEALKEFSEHIAECGACAGNIESDRQIDDALRSALGDEMPNASAVVVRVRKQIDSHVPWWHAPHLGWAKIGLAFAACLVLALASLGWLSTYRHQRAMAMAAADDHFNDLVLLRHSDWLVKPADMAALIQQQFPEHAGLLRLITPERSSLEKVRLCRLKQATYAHIVFKTGEVETSVFLIGNPQRTSGYQAADLRNVGHDLEVSGFSASDLSGIVVGRHGVVPTTQIARQLAERLSL
ncbi:MAG TPA: zf-HC2 domain-containing protein [Candidatus Angelobacter sp.]|nr:zf-HC2 domain-containing protein [Candidatus Angelobacter sp.]